MSAVRRGPWRLALRLAADRYFADAARCRKEAETHEAVALGCGATERAGHLARAVDCWRLAAHLDTLARDALDSAEHERRT